MQTTGIGETSVEEGLRKVGSTWKLESFPRYAFGRRSQKSNSLEVALKYIVIEGWGVRCACIMAIHIHNSDLR